MWCRVWSFGHGCDDDFQQRQEEVSRSGPTLSVLLCLGGLSGSVSLHLCCSLVVVVISYEGFLSHIHNNVHAFFLCYAGVTIDTLL